MHMYGRINAHEPGCFGLVSCMCRHSNMTALCCCGNRHALQQVPATRRKGNAEAQLTLPKWEFSCGEDRGTMKTVRHAHTLKSHHITSLDAADGTLRFGTVQRRSLPQPHCMVSLAITIRLDLHRILKHRHETLRYGEGTVRVLQNARRSISEP